MLKSLLGKWKQKKEDTPSVAEEAVAPQANTNDAEDETIRCSTHGSGQITYVCRHLIEQPVQQWHCGYPEEDKPWRDAWCSECNAAFEREGEWNEHNEGTADIKLLCSSCYDDLLGKSVERLDRDVRAAWQAYTSECCRSLEEKQNALRERFQFDHYPRWDYDQQSARLIFSGADAPDLVADVEFVGTLSTMSDTWKWSWANFSLLEPVRSRIAAARDLGEVHGYPHLTVPLWPAEMADGWHMTGIAAEVLGAHGAYHVPTDNGYIFMLIMGMDYAQ